MLFNARNLILGLLLLLGCAQLAAGSWVHIKAALAQQLLQRAWEGSLATGLSSKPRPWADTVPIARLQLPRLGVDSIVLSGDHGQSLAFGPGHTSASALPGESGAMLISGHRDTHFRFMRDIKVGDSLILIAATGKSQRYQIIKTQVVDAEKTQIQAVATDQLLLATCWPFDSVVPGGPLRFVVIAEPVSEVQLAQIDIH